MQTFPAFAHGHLWGVGAVIVVIVAIYLRQFVWPALRLKRELLQATAVLDELQGQDSVAAKVALERDGGQFGTPLGALCTHAATGHGST